jgi:hypothetical protein
MASSYSPSLKIELIGNGDQSGTWGTTTNNNLGTLVEQAITGVQNITMVNADYTLTNYNGVSDEARNAVLVVDGTNSAVRQIIIPANQEKLYVIRNNTSGGYAITIGAITGATISIPNGVTAQVYYDGTDCFSSQTGSAGNFTVNGTLTATGITDTGALSATTISGTTLTASTQFSGPGTGLTGTASALNIGGNAATATTATTATTAGNVSGIVAVANGGTGAATLTANNVLLGNGTSTPQAVAPSTSGNVLTSNGTTWVSSTPATTNASQLAKAWVNFNGTGTIAIRSSYNVSSITDLGVGEYQVNFTTAMADANYSMLATQGGQETSVPIEMPRRSTTPTTTAVRIIYNNGNSDSLYISVAIFD